MLKDYIDREGCLGVVRTASGEIIEFHRRGVIDLLELLIHQPEALRGASVADKVIGRGAALLLVKGGVSHVYARLISNGAIEVLTWGGVRFEYGEETPYIRNRSGDGLCPIERLTALVTNPNEAFSLIAKMLNVERWS